jgi:F-type H+-transporting ATPase subunit gamma
VDQWPLPENGDKRACAESLASENASRLAAEERADKNIIALLEQFHGTFHQLR